MLTRLPGRALLTGLLLVLPASAQAQAFTLPQQCQHGATGSEGDDPVVILVDNYTTYADDNFTLLLVATQPVIQWGIRIAPFRGGQSGYSIFTTYTPFLTSSAFVAAPSSEPSYDVFLPQPGQMAGRKTEVWDHYTIQIKYQSQIIPYAYVDFIPDFVGSSPLTIQADGNGLITLYCVQQNFDGYNITVYDQNHNYVFDGSFPASVNLAAVDGTIGAETRPHPDGTE